MYFNNALKRGDLVKSIIYTAESVIEKILSDIPSIEGIRIKDRNKNGFVISFIMDDNNHKEIRILWLDHAFPKNVVNTLDSDLSDDYRIIMAPYISDDAAKICKDKGVGYCDLSMNCMILFEYIYIHIRGNPNKYPTDNQAKSLFKASSKTTSLILRELMNDISVKWKIKDLSERVNCSIGLVSRVKTYLCNHMWAEADSDGFFVTAPESLMKSWGEAYSIPETINCYTLDSLSLFEQKCYKAYQDSSINACLTGFSGGVRYSPVVRYTKIHIWVDRKDLNEFIMYTGCKVVDSGSNIAIYIADSEEVFSNCKVIDNSRVASPVQIYLDCMQLKGRGEEMANSIFNKEIKK